MKLSEVNIYGRPISDFLLPDQIEIAQKQLDESPAPDGWVRFNEVDISNGLYDVWVEEITRPVRHYYAGGRWINQEKIMLPEYYGIEFIKPLPQPPKQ